MGNGPTFHATGQGIGVPEDTEQQRLARCTMPSKVDAACARMTEAGLPAAVVANYRRLLEQVITGNTGIIGESAIKPVSDVDTWESIHTQAKYTNLGKEALSKVAIVRLNGGLGTSMGMPGAKSLLAIKDGKTFNDLMIEQLIALQRSTGHQIPLIHMTSFRTDADIKRVMATAGYTNPNDLPTTFQQHRHLKIYADDYSPANEAIEALNWNPPGHGDIYASLLATGIAEKLLAAGKPYVFVANSDNLGATVAPEILGYMIHHHCPFLMETCRRTDADKKGGHLAKDAQTGNLILREVAQAPTRDGQVIPEFSDIQRYSQFNTNSIWLDLEQVVKVAKLRGGCIPLPLIRNIKPVNPEDRSSRLAIQIETAMGAAIGIFSGARALEVPRDRFMPVKTTNDLLLLMSDVYGVITENGQIVRRNPSQELPQVTLDPEHYAMIAEFNKLVIHAPSLLEARELNVIGAWKFGRPISIKGKVKLIGVPCQVNRIPDSIHTLENVTYTAQG
jgi:UTP--glucose-1-phosphate uridylyltransferase